jgi:hypothetical protein
MGAMGIGTRRMGEMCMLHLLSPARADAHKFWHLAMVGIGVRGYPWERYGLEIWGKVCQMAWGPV